MGRPGWHWDVAAALFYVAFQVGMRIRLRPVYGQAYSEPVMEPTADRLVLVSGRHLDDLCELARRAADQVAMKDPALASALRGAAAQVRADAVCEPAWCSPPEWALDHDRDR